MLVVMHRVVKRAITGTYLFGDRGKPLSVEKYRH